VKYSKGQAPVFPHHFSPL